MSIRIGIGLDVFGAGIDANAQTIYNRIIADGGVSNLSRLNFFVKGLKAIYGDLANVPVCYDAHWIGYKLGSGTGATAGQAAAKLYSIKNTENLLTFSEEFDNAAWTKNSSTITPNATIAPNGTLTADKLIDTASSAQHWAFQSTTNTLTSATISCYMKKGERNWGVIRTRTTINDYFAWFNLDNGTLGTVESGITASITDAGNGWYRCIVVNPNPTTSANPSIIGLSNANNVTTYTGDGTSGIFVWGAQFNTGSVALPYTQTTTTTQTLADAVQSTAASQPLLLAHNGVSSDNYYYAVPTTGNYCLSSLSYNTSDWDVEFKINGKYASAQDRVVSTRIGGNGTTVTVNATSINLEYSIATVFYVATALVTNTNDVDYTIRVTRNSTTGAVTFIRNGVTLTTTGVQLLGTLDGVSNLIEINGCLAGVQAINAKIYYCNLYIAGNIVRNFNPAIYNASTSQTQWTSSTGEVWTISTGTATSGYKGVLVDRTIVMFDGVDDFLQQTGVNRGNVCTQYLAYKTENASDSGYAFIDSSNVNYSNAFTPEAANMKLYMNISLSGLQKTLGSLLTLWTSTNNQGVLNTLQKNNDTAVSNTYTPALSNNGLNIGKNGLSAVYQKGNLNTYLSATGVDTTTMRTAVYSFIKTLNNNAF